MYVAGFILDAFNESGDEIVKENLSNALLSCATRVIELNPKVEDLDGVPLQNYLRLIEYIGSNDSAFFRSLRPHLTAKKDKIQQELKKGESISPIWTKEIK